MYFILSIIKKNSWSLKLESNGLSCNPTDTIITYRSKKSLDLSNHQVPDLWRYAMTTDVLLLTKIHVQELERKWNTRISNQRIYLVFLHKK